MTTVAQLQQELNEMNAKRAAIKEANTIQTNWPKIKRTYSYRKTTIIKPQDLAL